MSGVCTNDWEVIRLEQVLNSIVGGGTPSKSVSTYYQGTIPWMSVKDMNKNTLDDTIDHITQEAVDNSSTNVIPAGIPIIATRMSLGKVVIAKFDSAINQDLKALFVNSNVEQSYLVYWYRSIATLIESLGTGTTVKGIRLEVLRDLIFPLAPLTEQKEIVALLDKHLAQVESTKTRLDGIPAILKSFRQSVLSAAVSGKLTEEWRKKQGHSLNEWKSKSLGDVALVQTGSTPLKSENKYYDNGDIPWLTSSVTGQRMVTTAKQFVTSFAVEECRLKIFEPGTLLVAMYGEGKTRGQVTEIAIRATTNQACAAVLVDNNEASKSYVKLCIEASYQETRRLAEGGNQPNLNLSKVRSIPVYLPPPIEEQEVINLVGKLFSFADKIEAQVNVAQERVNNLSQSLLAKAFSGELTAQWRAQNPDLIRGENSAAALLEKIKAERVALTAKNKATKGSSSRKKKLAEKTATKKVMPVAKELSNPVERVLAVEGALSPQQIFDKLANDLSLTDVFTEIAKLLTDNKIEETTKDGVKAVTLTL